MAQHLLSSLMMQHAKKIFGLLPALILFLGWRATYKILGYGASGDALMYVDPMQRTFAFLMQFAERLPRVLLYHIFSEGGSHIVYILGW